MTRVVPLESVDARYLYVGRLVTLMQGKSHAQAFNVIAIFIDSSVTTIKPGIFISPVNAGSKSRFS